MAFSKVLLLVSLLCVSMFQHVYSTSTDAINCGNTYNTNLATVTLDLQKCDNLRAYATCLTAAVADLDEASQNAFWSGFRTANTTLINAGIDCSVIFANPEINSAQGKLILSSQVDVELVLDGMTHSLKTDLSQFSAASILTAQLATNATATAASLSGALSSLAMQASGLNSTLDRLSSSESRLSKVEGVADRAALSASAASSAVLGLVYNTSQLSSGVARLDGNVSVLSSNLSGAQSSLTAAVSQAAADAITIAVSTVLSNLSSSLTAQNDSLNTLTGAVSNIDKAISTAVGGSTITTILNNHNLILAQNASLNELSSRTAASVATLSEAVDSVSSSATTAISRLNSSDVRTNELSSSLSSTVLRLNSVSNMLTTLQTAQSRAASCLAQTPPTLYNAASNDCFSQYHLTNNVCETNNGGCAQQCSRSSSTGLAVCSCNPGFVLGSDGKSCICAAGYTSSSCTACAKGTFKSATGSDDCTACPTGFTTTGPASTAAAACSEPIWTNVGVINDFDTITGTYSQFEYEYGIAYNGDVQVAIHSSWNRGTRITLYPFFPQLDSNPSLAFGTQILTRGVNLNNDEDSTSWYSHYYRYDSTAAAMIYAGSNGIVNSNMYVRGLRQKWVAAGTMADYFTTRSTYPSDQYEFGITYNGQIRSVFSNGWNQGTRVTAFPIYPMGDDSLHLNMGTVTVTNGLNKQPNTWEQNYYFWPNSRAGGNGDGSGIALYRRAYAHPWVNRGQVKDLSSIRSSYPDRSFHLGMSYNGDIQQAFRSTVDLLNQRVTTLPTYPMGDDYDTLHWGVTVWMDVGGNSFTQKYYRMDSSGFTDEDAGSNGNIDTGPIYTQLTDCPWMEVGQLEDYFTLRSTYSTREYEYGVAYDGDIQVMFMNGWNRGYRLSLHPIHPTNTNIDSPTFGTKIFATGLEGIKNRNCRMSILDYEYPMSFLSSTDPDDVCDVFLTLYVRRFCSHHMNVGWGG